MVDGKDVAMAAGRKGFVTLDYYRDGSVWIVVLVPEGDGSQGDVLFRARILEDRGGRSSESVGDPASEVAVIKQSPGR